MNTLWILQLMFNQYLDGNLPASFVQDYAFAQIKLAD